MATTTMYGGKSGGKSGDDDDASTVDSRVDITADPWSLAIAALFRASTYVGATAVGVAFLGGLPRSRIPVISSLGSRTVYGYLLHAPVLLGLFASLGVFARAGEDDGLGGSEAVWCGVGLPALVTAACMSRLAKACFWWLCEPKLGGWVWRPKEEERVGDDL